MDDATRTVDPVVAPRARISLRSALVLVLGFGATVLAVEIIHDAERVIFWVLSAIAIAALAYPAIEWLAHFRFVPRAVAVIITVLAALGTLGFLGYRIVDDVSKAMSSLQSAAPARVAALEKNSDFFREIKLEDRVQRLVDAIPQRLAGGETTEALKSAATRSVAFLAGLILTIFFVLYGGRLIDGGLGLIDDVSTREKTRAIVVHGSGRALYFARVKIWEAAVEGLLAYGIARAAGVPGPAALAIWVALWSFLPVAGVLIGALPIVVFAGAHTTTRAIVVALCFVVIGIGDWQVNRWLERRSVYVGSFPIVLAAFAGLELYGLTGALLFLLAAVFAVSIIGEIGPEEVAEAIVAAPPVEGSTPTPG